MKDETDLLLPIFNPTPLPIHGETLEPTDEEFNVLSLFDGMSCGQIALDEVGITPDNYFASEVDEKAIKVAMYNYPNTNQVGDVRNLDVSTLPKIDLLIGGSPCQGFSVAGKRKGSSTSEGIDVTSLEQYLDLKYEGFEFEGQSYLFWEFIRVLNELRKINPDIKFMLENVRVSKKWLPMFNETLGLEPEMINSKRVSAQKRPRYYWFNWDLKTFEDNDVQLTSILEDIPCDKPFSPYMTKEFDGISRLEKGIFTFTTDTKACCLTTGSGRGNKYLLDKESKTYRKLTRNEMERLQGVPDNTTRAVSTNQAGKLLGNGWTIPVIVQIFKNLNLTPIHNGKYRR